MKHPFWLLNSILLALLCFSFLFIIVTRPSIPSRVSFEPSEIIRPIKKDLTKLDLSKIYTNDLFDTYKSPTITTQEPSPLKPLPKPPSPKPSTKPSAQPIRFLEPLKIVLRGIISSSDEQKSIAILENPKDGKSRNNKVGDTIEDAQLIRILKNKIILIRSNGQQETLYVSQHDAEIEQLLLPKNNWSGIIHKVDENSYEVYSDLFVERVRTLSTIIDLLNITSVYQQGKNIGCRIGRLEPNSLGQALGLKTGDIILRVNAIEATDTRKRFEIYQSILSLDYDDTITIDITRQNKPISLYYALRKNPDNTTLDQLSEKEDKLPEVEHVNEQKKMDALEKKYKFAPTLEEIKRKEKQDIQKMSRTNSSSRKNQGILMNTVKPE